MNLRIFKIINANLVNSRECNFVLNAVLCLLVQNAKEDIFYKIANALKENV